MKAKHLEPNDKHLEFFERRKRDHKGEERSWTSASSTNSNTLRASYFVSHGIAKTNMSFTIGEQLIRPGCIDICHKVLGESAAGSSFVMYCCGTN